jgi:hypothetical protein
MISTLADGLPAGDLEKSILRLKLIKEAQDRKISWNVLARVLGCESGKQLKKDTHALAEHVSRELTLAKNRGGTEPLGSARD